MEKITVDLGSRSYPVWIGSGILEEIGRYLSGEEVCVVTDPTVEARFGGAVLGSIERAGKKGRLIVVPEGERSKDFSRLMEVYDALVSFGADRSTELVALGGGVIGDLGGFSAATFMRGIPLVQVPTTLLSQVDSSVGGKTAVNHPRGKNLIGVFYQPRLVFIDIDTLSSLPQGEFLSGLAEVIKYGIVLGEDLFYLLEQKRDLILKRDRPSLTAIVSRSVEIKADVVAKDEREAGLRSVLNFGHTLGHAIENLVGYGAIRHGEAVAKGMAMSTLISERMGLISEGDKKRIMGLLAAYGYDLVLPAFSRQEYAAAIAADKKAVGDEINFVLTGGIGRFILKKISVLDILDFIEH
jgi:3-dehydroquinate synthase